MWLFVLSLTVLVGWTQAQSCSRYPEFQDSSGICRRDVLNEPCINPVLNSCEYGVVNGWCNDDGTCDCKAGFHQTKSLKGQLQCTRISEGSACVPGTEGDQVCQLALQDSNAFCDKLSCGCECPSGTTFTGITCQPRLFASKNPECSFCTKSGGACYDEDNDGNADGCYCPGKSFSSGVQGDDQLEFGCNGRDADVGEQCSRGLAKKDTYLPEPGSPHPPGVICRDPNAECTHCAALSGRHICTCRPGYVEVVNSPVAFSDTPSAPVCHKLLTVTEDADCEFCNLHGGQCYDINDDQVMDGCVCPHHRTTIGHLPEDMCNFENVVIDCDNSTMRVCLVANTGPVNIPPNLNDVINELDNGHAQAYIRGRGNDSRCHLEQQSNGEWCIDLITESTLPGTFHEKCGALVVKPTKIQTSYMTWVTLQRNRSKSTLNDFCLHAYCTYDDIKYVSNGTVINDLKHVVETGKEFCPTVRIYLEDKWGEEKTTRTPVITGDHVRLVIEYTDDLGGIYTHLRPEICILSNLPRLDIPGVRTILFVDRGRLVENGYISFGSNFRPDPTNSRISRSGFFSMCMFEDSDYVFFHCAVRVCRRAEPCQPMSKKRKRRSVAFEGTVKLPETLAELEKSGEFEIVNFKHEITPQERAASINARERMDNPYLANADLAIRVAKGDRNNDEMAPIKDQPRKVIKHQPASSMDDIPEVKTAKVKKAGKSSIDFVTLLLVVGIGTAALTFTLTMASFYLVSVLSRRQPDQKHLVKE